MAQAALPTYRTAARVLEGENGSGLRLAAWTVARTIMIGPPMMVVGVPVKQAFFGAALASILISGFTVLRIFNERQVGLEGRRANRQITRRRRRASR